MGYVRQHLGVLGLTRADLRTFTLRRDYVDIAGIHHLSWTQSVDAIPLFGNGLRANVTANGRLLSLQGSPVSGLERLAAKAGPTARVSATRARDLAAADVGGKPAAATSSASKNGTTVAWSNFDYAKLVWFHTPSGVRLAWSTYVQAGGDNLSYQHVIDASHRCRLVPPRHRRQRQRRRAASTGTIPARRSGASSRFSTSSRPASCPVARRG